MTSIFAPFKMSENIVGLEIKENQVGEKKTENISSGSKGKSWNRDRREREREREERGKRFISQKDTIIVSTINNDSSEFKTDVEVCKEDNKCHKDLDNHNSLEKWRESCEDRNNKFEPNGKGDKMGSDENFQNKGDQANYGNGDGPGSQEQSYQEISIINEVKDMLIANDSSLFKKMKTAEELEAKWKQEEEEKEAQLKIQRIQEEEQKLMMEYCEETREKIINKASLRQTNLAAAANRPEESFFGRLDSNLKKNTAFVKRLKNMTEAQKTSLIKDMEGLNLTKYISEVATAIAEAKLKMSDVSCAVLICSLLHQRYSDFAVQLLENWQKILVMKKDDKVMNPSKLRVDLRFFAELLASGIFTDKEGLPILGNVLTMLTNSDKEDHNNLSIILSFCKHCGEDYVGLLPRKIRNMAEKYKIEIPKSDIISIERQKAVRMLLKEYFTSLCRHLIKEHKELQIMERQNRRILQTKGELNSERKDKLENALQAYQKLLTNTITFADMLDEDMPELPIDESARHEADGGSLDTHNPFKNQEFQYDGDVLWEDEDTRNFYENLPDLKAFIPGILFKDSEQSNIQTASIETLEEVDLSTLDLDTLALEDSVIEGECKEKDDVEILKLDIKEEDEDIKKPDIQLDEGEVILLEPEDVEEETENINSTLKLLLDAFLAQLPNCVNRELIDKAAVDFCMNLNTKSNRKKLVRTLFSVPRTRLDLLPFYARFVATLYPCMPDVATDLSAMLKQDFKYHVRKKDQINIESKVKIVRFIGELVKFKMFSKAEVLHCVKMLLFDFTHHHIEMACNLLETCGRFLFRSPESHQRTRVYLDQMMRKKTVMHLDSRYTTMIENAFYYCNPPELPQTVVKERPPLYEYIRKLLYKDLTKTTTEKVLRQIRKLSWEDPDVCFYATKCMTAVWNVKYNNIHCMANLLAGLVPYQEHIGSQVVDGILEDIRLGMEVNHPKYNQRRVSEAKFLGELYNYRMVESSVIFKTLYAFITFGVYLNGIPSILDPPEHLFRIRLVCVVLDTCGQYFDRGSSKKKLDCFLVYFQRYYWFKKINEVWNEDRPFPIDVDNLVRETIETVRPKLKICSSSDESRKAVEELEKEYINKIAKMIPSLQKESCLNLKTVEQYDDLPPIKEADEQIVEELSQGFSQTQIEDDHTSLESDIEIEPVHSGSQSCSQANEADVTSANCQDEDINGEGEADGEIDDDVIESAGENEDEDSVRVLTGGPKHMTCPEDEDFMTAFDKMMAENIQQRSQEAIKVPQLDIAVPFHLKSQLKNKGGQYISEEDINTINFVLMTRKGNKQQYKSLQVPLSAEIAVNLKDREQAERAEKERMKRLVLDINERQEEEDYQEMLVSLQRPAVMNLNRERRQKYQHPKGAPDADLIFGTKKR